MSTKRKEWIKKVNKEFNKVFRFWKFMAVSGVLISFISFFAAKIFFNATSVEAKQTACILGIIFIAFMLIAGTRTIIITYPPDDLDE